MYPPNTTPEDSDNQQLTLKKILLALTGGGGGGGLTDAQLRASPVPVSSTAAGASHGVVTIIPTTGQSAGTASLAARATRTSVLIRNLTNSPETVWFSYTTGVNATTGMQLLVGESVSVGNVAQIFFFSSAGTAVVNCAEDYN